MEIWDTDELAQNLVSLKQMLEANVQGNYIRYIVFPSYKNFEPDTEINFKHPITILTGKNGLGKSSCLHALYGSPVGYSISDFWFSTVVDPIKEAGDSSRHQFFYAYGSEELEVIYSRILKKGNPDYWETSRPILAAGMKKLERTDITRNPPVRKEVIYIDFRSELSPYDQYYYFSEFQKTKRIKTKQDYIRERSKFLKEVIDTNSEVRKWTKIKGDAPRRLSSEELDAVKFILDKEYSDAILIRHNFFTKNFSDSIIFNSDSLNYSEAHAGSGEISIVKIVKRINEAKPNSLILLDEPEVSLHPQAQKRLMVFLSRYAKIKKLQIVISTHSSDIVELFNSDSIKLLFQPKGNHKVKILEDISPEVTFDALGRTLPPKKMIFVEDILAKNIIEKVIQLSDDENIKNLTNIAEVQYYPGGESYLKTTFIPLALNPRIASKVVFDGDQRHGVEISSLKLSLNLEKKVDELKQHIKEVTGINFHNISFPLNSLNSSDDLILVMQAYLKYFDENVDYLPKMIPEDILWKENLLEVYLQSEGALEFCDYDKKHTTSKDKLYDLCLDYEKKPRVTNEEYYRFLDSIIRKWIESKDEDYVEIIKILKKYT